MAAETLGSATRPMARSNPPLRGQVEKARSEIAKAVEVDPEISLADFAKLSLNKDEVGMDKGLARLRRLGLPE